MSRFISASVGRGGHNLREDVRIVQELLAERDLLRQEPTGECDDATLAAIERLQTSVLRHPDGRIDADGPTWRHLSSHAHATAADDHADPPAPARQPARVITDHELLRWVSRDGQELRFASLQGVPERAGRWTFRSRQAAIPPDAHPVPVMLPVRTPLVPGGFNRLTFERVRYLDAIRHTLRQAGLDWDARVLMPLWANESGWDRFAYGNNMGNIKSQGSVHAPSFPEMVRTRTVHVTVPESVGVMVFTDRWQSIDGYHVFATPADYARYAARIFARYPGALRALQHGGQEGAAAFARALQGNPRHRYSPAPVDSAVREFLGSWRRSHALIGDAAFLP